MEMPLSGVMRIIGAMTVIIVHALFDMDVSNERGYIASAKCVVVSQQQKQQNELSGEENNKTDKKTTNENTIWTTITAPCYYCDHGHLRDQYEGQYQIIATLNVEDKKVVENIADGQKRWRKVIIEAMEMQQARHYKQSLNLPYKPILENDDNRSVDVQVCHTLEQANNTREGNQCDEVKA
ncbi:unnamed protein product [Onchocerca ochengi]|uniref:DUF3456 domain-containing protein n=1 Tax=Onchocerca ochengi TaxID=42157 RepID=A0A182EE19_ONCOC|nr:unnamed protein product [Onchocerca ochengi]